MGGFILLHATISLLKEGIAKAKSLAKAAQAKKWSNSFLKTGRDAVTDRLLKYDIAGSHFCVVTQAL